jgi:hypothetical protein
VPPKEEIDHRQQPMGFLSLWENLHSNKAVGHVIYTKNSKNSELIENSGFETIPEPSMEEEWQRSVNFLTVHFLLLLIFPGD